MIKKENINLTKEWDKTFPKSEKVNHTKVTFNNRFGITLAADMYEPKEIKGKMPAIAVCGPFGAVKEQCSGLYAQTMAERGFITIAFDPSFCGESGGNVRYVASPDINTEDFSAAVDFLSAQENVDADRISIIGICGWGGFALNAAAIDTRIKATVTSTMYDMHRVTFEGYYGASDNDDIRYGMKEQLNKQRTEDYIDDNYKLAGGLPETLPEEAPQFMKDYVEYYKNRAYHKRSLNSNNGWNITSSLSLLNTPILAFSNEIRNSVLMIHGSNAHSRYFSEDAFKNMITAKGDKWKENKELLIVPEASHCDLYDGGGNDYIPFDKIESFIREAIDYK